jgi:hypothetical protein
MWGAVEEPMPLFGASLCTVGVFVGLWIAHGEHPWPFRMALLEVFIILICVGVALALFGV